MIDQGEFFKIPSPCQGICQMNSKGYCVGCFRNRDERLYWQQFSEFQKQLIVNLCDKRKKKVIKAKQQSNTPVVEDTPPPQFDLFYEVKLNTPIAQTELPSKTESTQHRDEEQLDLF